jgi:regulator of protease activity HflC (stomatin/prohibitin superfamily)
LIDLNEQDREIKNETRRKLNVDELMENKPLMWVIGIVIAIVIFFMLCPFVIVGPGERGVVTHLGKVDMGKIFGEGFHLRTPIITGVHKMTVQIQKSEIPADGATKDLQIVNCGIAVNWKLDPEKVNTIYQTIGNENDVLGDIMSPAINEVVKAATAKRNAQTILVERTALKEEIDLAFRERMAKYGIVIVDVSLVNFSFGEDFQKAIEDKQIAEQDAQKAVYVAKMAEAEAQAVINKAKGEAEAQRLQKITLSSVMLKKLWLDKWDGQLPKVMTSDKGGIILDLKSMGDDEVSTKAVE